MFPFARFFCGVFPRSGRTVVCAALAGVMISAAEPAGQSASPQPGAPTLSAITEWGKQLSDPDKVVRREAAYQLSRVGAAAKPVIPELIKALEDSEQQVWFGAVVAIAQIGPEAKDAIPNLMRGLNRRAQREGRQVWFRSSHALGRMGPAAVPALLEGLTSSDSLVRGGSAQSLGWIGPDARDAVPALLDTLKDSESSVRDLAGEALANIGSAAIPGLLALISNPDARLREESARSLARLKQAGANHSAQVLAQLAAESEAGPRASQLQCLSAFGCEDPQFFRLLIEGLMSDDDLVRHAAVNGLVSFPNAVEATVPAMRQWLSGESQEKKALAASVLERMGRRAVAAIPDLIRAARVAEKTGTGAPFIRALASMGPETAPPLLVAAEEENSEAVSHDHWIVRSFAAIGPDCAPVLTEALPGRGSPNTSAQLVALEALRLLGKEAAAAGGAVAGLLDAESPRVRARALATLLAITPRTETLLPQIQRALQDGEAPVRLAATAAVADLGAAGEPCIPLLIRALGDKEPAVRLNSARALGGLGDKATAAIEPLIEFLRGADSGQSPTVVEALGRIGTAAGAATPLLVEQIEKGGLEQRLAAVRALGRFGAKASAATAAVQSLVSDPASELRAAALQAVARVCADPDAILPLLEKGLEDEATGVRTAAAEALGGLGEKAQSQAPKLFAMLKQSEERSAALDSLRQIKCKEVPLFVEALKNEDPSVRIFACESLTALGPSAKEATPALREALRDSYDAVRRQARAALRAVEEKRP